MLHKGQERVGDFTDKKDAKEEMKQLIRFDNLSKALADYANDFVWKYKENLSESGRKASGRLITSINSRVMVNGSEFDVTLSLEDYYIFVEKGTRPHMPPVSKILEWLRIKPVLPYPMQNGKLPTQRQLAWMIARKIEREGTEGSNDLERTFDETEYWEQRIADALDEDVMNMIEGLL